MNASLDSARAVSDAVSAAVFDAIPVPMVRESCSEMCWRLYDEAQESFRALGWSETAASELAAIHVRVG